MGDYQDQLTACMSDTPSCLDVVCCGPCQVGRQCSAIEDNKPDTPNLVKCVLTIVCPFCSVFKVRTMINDKYSIDEGAIGVCLKSLLCGPCVVCQNYRELSRRNVWPGGFCIKEPPTMR